MLFLVRPLARQRVGRLWADMGERTTHSYPRRFRAEWLLWCLVLNQTSNGWRLSPPQPQSALCALISADRQRLIRPRGVGIEIDGRHRRRRWNHRPQIRPADRLVARIATLDHRFVGRREFHAVLLF